jgi:hypothetical protein
VGKRNVLIGLAGRVDADEARQRFGERDARLRADRRADLEKYFGDPDYARSAWRLIISGKVVNYPRANKQKPHALGACGFLLWDDGIKPDRATSRLPSGLQPCRRAGDSHLASSARSSYRRCAAQRYGRRYQRGCSV